MYRGKHIRVSFSSPFKIYFYSFKILTPIDSFIQRHDVSLLSEELSKNDRHIDRKLSAQMEETY